MDTDDLFEAFAVTAGRFVRERDEARESLKALYKAAKRYSDRMPVDASTQLPACGLHEDNKMLGALDRVADFLDGEPNDHT